MAAIARGGVSGPSYIDYRLSQSRESRNTPTRKISSISKINTCPCQAEFSERKRSKPYSRSPTFYCHYNNNSDVDGRRGNWGLNFGAKLGEQFHGIVRKFLENLKGKEERSPQQEWDSWQEYFHLVETKANSRSDLEILLELAIKTENYKEATKLKLLIDEITAYDTTNEVISQLKKAVEEERYEDATKLRDLTSAGLVGWWSGLADGASDPYGRIIRISPEHGRFVAKSYNARQLAAGGPGIPLFEIFITKDGDQEYKQQAVYLQRNGQFAKDTKEQETEIEKNDDTELEDEGLRHVLKFLKAGMPGLKFKVLKIATPERAEMDIISGVFDQLIQDINKGKTEEITTSGGSVHEFRTEADLHNDKVAIGADDFIELVQFAAAKVAFGTLLQSIAEDAPPNLPVRVAAKVERRGHDSFCFQIENNGNQQSTGGKGMALSWKVATVTRQTSAVPMSADVPEVPWNVDKQKVAETRFASHTIVLRRLVRVKEALCQMVISNKWGGWKQVDTEKAKIVKDLIFSDDFWNRVEYALELTEPLMSMLRYADTDEPCLGNIYDAMDSMLERMKSALQDFGEIITLAVSEAQKRRGLHASTVFHRINIEAANADPFCGLYTGTFGPYTSEVIQLRRRVGQWHDDNAIPSKDSKFEYYEYVEAVKLTGNMIIPAGQVTFRAKIGKQYLLPHRDIYPEELGVIARYKGQERRAQSGFRNREWADAEILLLDGKGTGSTTGPHLGFLLSLHEYPIPVWFKRLNLPAEDGCADTT